MAMIYPFSFNAGQCAVINAALKAAGAKRRLAFTEPRCRIQLDGDAMAEVRTALDAYTAAAENPEHRQTAERLALTLANWQGVEVEG